MADDKKGEGMSFPIKALLVTAGVIGGGVTLGAAVVNNMNYSDHRIYVTAPHRLIELVSPDSYSAIAVDLSNLSVRELLSPDLYKFNLVRLRDEEIYCIGQVEELASGGAYLIDNFACNITVPTEVRLEDYGFRMAGFRNLTVRYNDEEIYSDRANYLERVIEEIMPFHLETKEFMSQRVWGSPEF